MDINLLELQLYSNWATFPHLTKNAERRRKLLLDEKFGVIQSWDKPAACCE